jgi:lantibiotic leader peptide-processing serine protease
MNPARRTDGPGEERCMRVRGRWIAAAVLAAAFVGSGTSASAATTNRYVVVAKTAAGYDALRAEAIASGARVVTDLRQINAMVVVGPQMARDRLRRDQRTYGVGLDHITQVAPPESVVFQSRLPGKLGARRLAITPDPAVGLPGLLWSLKRIDAPTAWSVTTGSPDVTVGVADTGLDFTHPELAAQVTNVADFTASEDPPLCKTFFTFNGQHLGDSDLAAMFGGPATTDWNGHGSWIGGNIAAALDGVGINGIAPGIKLQALKISGWCGSSYDTTELEAFLYAADHGIDVVSISFGGYLDRHQPGGNLLYHLYRATVQYARNHGTVIAASAGNEHVLVGKNGQVLSHGQLSAPGAPLPDLYGQYEVPGGIPGVIDVSSTNNVVAAPSATCDPAKANVTTATCKPVTDAHQSAAGSTNQLAYYSDYGPRINIAGPGGARKFNLPVWDRGGTPGFPVTQDDGLTAFQDFSITSNWATGIPCFTFPASAAPVFYPGACYSTIQGTSMAAPHVSATLALIASAFPDLRHHPRALIKKLYAGARKLNGNNHTPPINGADTSPGDLTGVACAAANCHLGGAPISAGDAYGHGLVNAARSVGAK